MRMLKIDICFGDGYNNDTTSVIALPDTGFSLLLNVLETHPSVVSYRVYDLLTITQIFPESIGQEADCRVKWEPLGYQRKKVQEMPWESGNPDAY